MPTATSNYTVLINNIAAAKPDAVIALGYPNNAIAGYNTGLVIENVAFLGLADRVYTLEGGRIGFEGTVAALHADHALRRAYFGLEGG